MLATIKRVLVGKPLAQVDEPTGEPTWRRAGISRHTPPLIAIASVLIADVPILAVHAARPTSAR